MKVLIVRVGALGDVLHALPAVAALRRAHPDWQIDWVVDPRWAPLLVDSQGVGPIASRVHLAETKLWSSAPFSAETFHSVRALRRSLRGQHYDLAVDMQGTLRSSVLARFSAAPRRVGYADPREPAATLFYTRKISRQGAHVVDQGAALLGAAIDEALLPAPAVLPHEAWADQWAAAEIADRKLCVLSPGAGWGAKRWPVERFGALAQTLKGQGFDVAVNAPRNDDALAANVVSASGGAARTVVCNVTGLIALTRRASLLIGGDSGPTHLAAALGVPVVALFGPTDPARNGPWGAGPKTLLRHPSSITSYKRTAETDPGLARIEVDEVLDAALTLSSLRE